MRGCTWETTLLTISSVLKLDAPKEADCDCPDVEAVEPKEPVLPDENEDNEDEEEGALLEEEEKVFSEVNVLLPIAAEPDDCFCGLGLILTKSLLTSRVS